MSTSTPPTPSPRHRSTSVNHRALPPPPPPLPPPPRPSSTKPNLTTTLYHTNTGLFALTWSRNLFGRSLYLYLVPSAAADGDEYLSPPSLSTTATITANNPSFHLQIKPFIFWNKYGSKKIPGSSPDKPLQVFWDLSRAKFESGPEPVSGFYIAVLVAGKMTLLVGDSPKQALSKTKLTKPDKTQITVLRREHVHAIGNKKYTTRASFRGKTREISIDCRLAGDDSRLYFSVDNKRVLQVKHLKWKFRGNERIEIDGVHIQISWDVYNWLFEEEREEDGHALFMFRFEKSGFDYHEDDKFLAQFNEKGGLGMGFRFGLGGFGFERKNMKKSGLLRTARSSSSSSLSSASSSCGSVMEWESVEENELKGPSGFSLLVYAWKS